MPLEEKKESDTRDHFLDKLSKILLSVGDEDDSISVVYMKEEWFRLLYPLLKKDEPANKAQTKEVAEVENYQAAVKSRMLTCLNQTMKDPEVKAVIALSKTGQVSDEVRPAVIDLGAGGVKLAISPGLTKGQLTIEIAENSPPDKIQRWEKMKREN